MIPQKRFWSYPSCCGGITQLSLTGGDSLPALFRIVSFHCIFSDHIKEKFVNEDFLDNLVRNILLTWARQSHKNAFFKEELQVLFGYGQPLYMCSNAYTCVCVYVQYLLFKTDIQARTNHLCSWCATVVWCQWVLEPFRG